MARPRVQALTAGPWLGVRDTTDPGDDAPRYLARLTNGYVPDPEGGSGAYARPGFKLLNSGAALGTVSGRKGQGIHQHTALDGTEYGFVFCGGKMYSYDPSTEALSDITPANITLSATNRVFCVSFQDEVIVNDGLHKPWRYNPATSTATVIEAYDNAVRLSRGTDDTKLATTAFSYLAGTTIGAKAATETAISGTVSAGTWGVFRVSISSAGTITITAPGTPQAYASEAAAIFALPAVPTDHFNVGYFTVLAQAGVQWVGGTDALQGGATGNVANTTNYYMGEADQWSAFGAPTVRSAKLVFALSYLNGVTARNAILWSEEGDASVGYQQTSYDNLWELTQTDSNALYGIKATEIGVYVLRARAGQIIYGEVDDQFTTASTRDPLATGTTSPATFLQDDYDALWFADATGRVVRLGVGSTDPDQRWLDMRRPVDSALASSGAASSLETLACGSVVPGFDLVAFALWASDGSSEPPTALHCFDQRTARYVGQWTIAGGIKIDAVGWLKNAQKRPFLMVLGTNSTSAYSASNAGYCWRLRAADEATWTDTGVTSNPSSAQTHRLGYAPTTEWHVLTVTATTASSAPCTLGYTTSHTASGSVSAATPASSQDGTYRAVWGTKAIGRGPQFTVTPTTATAQWGLHQVSASAIPLPSPPGAA